LSTLVVFATALGPSIHVAVRTSQKEIVTVTETNSTSSAIAEVIAPLTPMPMASVTMSTLVSVNSMLVGFAMAQAVSMSVDVPTSQKGTVTATATNSTPWAFAVGTVVLMPMPMACVTQTRSWGARIPRPATTMLTQRSKMDHVQSLIPAESAEGLEPCMNADVPTSQKTTATVMATKTMRLAFAEVIALKTATTTTSATRTNKGARM
tara:strand:- start:89 stop:712 length:624 start_codon:yes stop_codon:yes gene_type:complete